MYYSKLIALTIFIKSKLVIFQFIYNFFVNLVIINILLGLFIIAIIYIFSCFYKAYITNSIIY